MPKSRKKPRTSRVAEPAVDRTPTIPASTFKATCLELMDEIAASHREMIVTKYGRPVVTVGPADPTPPSPFGFLRNTVIEAPDVVGPDHHAWRDSGGDLIDPVGE